MKGLPLKSLVMMLLVLGIIALPGHIFSAAGPGIPGEGTRFLDLPDGFGWSEDEEDEPELIEFYSDEFEGDAFFFVLDRSSSMGQASSSGESKFAVLKRETVRAISGLTKRSVVSVVFYNKDQNPLVYGEQPIKMDGAGKAKMVGNVLGTPISNGSCMLRGVLKALEIAQRSQNEYRTLVLTADGQTTCPNGERDANRIFQNIMSHNVLRMPINTVYTGPQSGGDWTIGKPLLERLSRATNGKFKIAN